MKTNERDVFLHNASTTCVPFKGKPQLNADLKDTDAGTQVLQISTFFLIYTLVVSSTNCIICF